MGLMVVGVLYIAIKGMMIDLYELLSRGIESKRSQGSSDGFLVLVRGLRQKLVTRVHLFNITGAVKDTGLIDMK